MGNTRKVAIKVKKCVYLNGEWEFREKGEKKWKPGKVPGIVQLDLISLGEMPDPYFRNNEGEFVKLEEKEWCYLKTFSVKDNFLKDDRVELVFEGIDTFADIFFNGEFLGSARNMFIPYRYDITKKIKEKDNCIEVFFDSAIKKVKELEVKYKPYRGGMEPSRVYSRKAQYSYGWDWAPRLISAGLWKDVYLEGTSNARVKNPFFYTEKLSGNNAMVKIEADVETIKGSQLTAKVEVSYKTKPVLSLKTPLKKTSSEYKIRASGIIKDAKLWWPNGMGEQNLYQITISLFDKSGEKIEEEKFFSGIRIIKLIREKDTIGESFIFEINNKKAFCKGANWIPADSMLPKLKREDYFDLITKAKESSMNMLRVWGGGIYESDCFYEACDKAGIMVWQDFMYSCAEYPDEYRWFQKDARKEAEIIVKNLRNHPSIALWCGNNECNEVFPKDKEPKYLGNYIYKKILPEVVAENDSSRPYWISSPYGGRDPNNPDEGDRHSWEVWSNWRNYLEYKKDTGRFLSEFGFQAMPAYKTVLSYTKSDDRRIFSIVSVNHNKFIEGNTRLLRYIIGNIGFPKDYKSFIYLSQFLQAEAIKTGVEHWRSRKYLTSGTLYWQLNDCWPVASWSALDYYHRPKALWYYTKKFYASLLPYLYYKDGKIILKIINDHLNAKDVKIALTAYSFSGKKLGGEKLTARILGDSNCTIASFKPEELGIIPEQKPEMTIYYNPWGHFYPVKDGLKSALNKSVVYVTLKERKNIFTNYLLFGKFNEVNLEKPKIKVKRIGRKIVIVADKPAFGVFVEPEKDAIPSDNCLYLKPGVSVEIIFNKDLGKIKIFDISSMI